MKKIFSLASGLSAATAAMALFASPVFAVTGNSVDLCNTTQGGINAATLCGLQVGDVISTVINLFLFVAFVAALLYLIYGGIRWIMSGGDKEATGKAKGTVTAALIGLAVVLASWILLNIILTFFGGTGLNGLMFPTL